MKVLYCNLDEKYKNLIKRTIEIKENSHSPISNFKVGSCVMGSDGDLICGVNVEVSSFSPTICAERNAIFSFISTGKRKIEAIAINSSGFDTFPCGVCRQVIYELGKDAKIFIVNNLDDIKVFKIEELLPHGFRWED